MNKPKIVFIFAKEGAQNSNKYGGFAKKLQKAGGFSDYDVITIALENLSFIIDDKGEAKVIDSVSGFDIKQAKFVYFKSWQSMPDEAAAASRYLLNHQVQFMDTLALTKGSTKLSTTFKLWANDIAVPSTYYASKSDVTCNFLKSKEVHILLGSKFILKDINGAKGKMNFYVSADEAVDIITSNPDYKFVCQKFIPNKGDYRVGIYASKPGFIIQRISSGKSHLNNTSAGAKAIYLPVDEVKPSILDIAVRASKAADLQISGVDVIEDKDTGKLYILEVNQGSQIVSGAFVKENIDSYTQLVESAINRKKLLGSKKQLTIIGRRVVLDIVGTDICDLVAKVDTGAYQSAMHAENIVKMTDEKGDYISYEIIDPKTGKRELNITYEFWRATVSNSFGVSEDRYVVPMTFNIMGRDYKTRVSLTSRNSQKYPLLLGRKLLKGNFVIDVNLNELGHEL